MLLRIPNNLIELIIRELRRKDAIDKVSTFSNGFCQNRYRHVAGYEKFVKELKELILSGKLIRTLRSWSTEILLDLKNSCSFNTNFHARLLEGHVADKLQALWGNFMDIIGDLKLDYTTDDTISILEEKIKKWFQTFLDVYHASKRCDTLYAFFVCSCA